MDMAEKVGVGVGVFVVRDDKTFLMGKRQNAMDMTLGRSREVGLSSGKLGKMQLSGKF